MALPIETSKPVRLEDFVVLAKEGKKVEAKIELRTQNIQQKIHPSETEEKRGEIDAYLLIGDYTLKVKGESWQVSKIYVWGFADESLDIRRLHRNIANDRLKMDYQRLKEANIEFEAKYF
jgi:hypothetical protein